MVLYYIMGSEPVGGSCKVVPGDLHLLVVMSPPLEYGLDLAVHFKQIEYSKNRTMSPRRLGYKKALAYVWVSSFTHLC